MTTTATLLLSCADQKGLVAEVSRFIYEHEGNIIHADQHTDLEESVFVQRIEWELDGFGIDRAAISAKFAPIAERFDMDWRLRFSDERTRIALLVSKQAHCMYDLLARWRMGELEADIPLVISNHADLAGVANDFGVPFHHLPITPETKPEQEAAIRELVDEHDIDVIVLARYMQILSPEFVAAHPNRIINIHHSFLPAFAGARPYHQAHERGVKVIGATAHFVTGELDGGPIVSQDVAHVSHRDSVGDLVHKGRDLEKTVLARAVHLHLDNRLIVYGNKTVVFD
ncbi:MAG: formyltetrahydrofolate deformylase [Acidimicrobiia bacterium]|nr:formyltetrahydrofolate deformylase [Acidimicrobiia bacterium]